jgi:hypothetical protein
MAQNFRNPQHLLDTPEYSMENLWQFFSLRLDKGLIPNLPIRSKVGQWNWKSTFVP